MIDPMEAKAILRLAAARRHAETGSGKAIRRCADISLIEVAAVIGVDQSTVWRWEEGRNRPRGEAAVKWAELLADLDKVSRTVAS